jgi:N-methylhydantoinase B
MDDDGVGTTNIPIRLRVTVPPHGRQQKVLFDFTGTGPQVKGNINSTVTVTLAGVLYSLKAPARSGRAEQPGPDRDRRHQAPLGTLINSKFPARSRRAPTRRSASSTW